MPVYFTRGSTTVRVKEPTWPEGDETYPRQTIGISDGGRMQISIDGDPDVVVVLNFRRVPASEAEALKTFFGTTCSYAGYTFQYQDWNQVTYNNFRYMDGIHTWKRRRGGKYEFTLTMQQDMGI